MKRLKLRDEVKVVLLGVVIIAMLVFINDFTNKAVDQCIEAGNDVSVCEELRK